MVYQNQEKQEWKKIRNMVQGEETEKGSKKFKRKAGKRNRVTIKLCIVQNEVVTGDRPGVLSTRQKWDRR